MNYITAVKEKFEKILMGTNCIDKLFRDHVEDYLIIKEQPQAITFPDGRILYIGNFNLHNERKFFYGWAKIIGLLVAKIVNMEISTDRKRDLMDKADFDMLGNGKWMLEFLYMDGWFEKQLYKLLNKTLLKQQAYILFDNKKIQKKWRNGGVRWMKKYMDKESLIQTCWLIYEYNFDAVKKNLKILVEKMKMKSQTETYMYFWLQNCPGLTGKFSNAPALNIDSSVSEFLNKKPQRKKRAEVPVENKEITNG